MYICWKQLAENQKRIGPFPFLFTGIDKREKLCEIIFMGKLQPPSTSPSTSTRIIENLLLATNHLFARGCDKKCTNKSKSEN